MTSSQPQPGSPDLTSLWASARRLHPIYVELAREFVIDLPACADLEAGVEMPGRESVEQAQQWLTEMDDHIQVHQLRQFLQTSSLIDPDVLVAMLQHFLAKKAHTDAMRDKIDFLLVQHFSLRAPTNLDDNSVALTYVAKSLEPILGAVEIKVPVWLNGLDRVLDSACRCRSLDELLHGGVLEQGRKAKAQAGELFYLPIALVAFTRFGYLMRRVFFRLMLADLNSILDGLTELEESGVETIDCRRAQFSAQEPVVRLRMICQSWKVMFQAEYSSGQPLRMLVDLRASVDAAVGRGAIAGKDGKGESHSMPSKATLGAAAAAAAGSVAPAKRAAARRSQEGVSQNPTELAAGNADAVEFEVSAAPEWNPDADSQPGSGK